MIDLPPALPEDYPAPPALVQTCADQAAQHFSLPPMLIRAIAEVEGGEVGTVSENTNGTYDLGIMQINTIHLPKIEQRFGVGWRELAYKPCVNIGIGAWILSDRVGEAEDLWTGVGNYHSRTPHLHKNYQSKVIHAYRRLMDALLGRQG